MLGLVAVLYLLGRRFKWPIPGIRRKPQQQNPIFDRWEKPELDNSIMIKHKRQEMDAAPVVRYEMVGSDPVELPGEYVREHHSTLNSSGVNDGTRTS